VVPPPIRRNCDIGVAVCCCDFGTGFFLCLLLSAFGTWMDIPGWLACWLNVKSRLAGWWSSMWNCSVVSLANTSRNLEIACVLKRLSSLKWIMRFCLACGCRIRLSCRLWFEEGWGREFCVPIGIKLTELRLLLMVPYVTVIIVDNTWFAALNRCPFLVVKIWSTRKMKGLIICQDLGSELHKVLQTYSGGRHCHLALV